jgi:tetrahydromethanopterin S-methyltransferase subunit G
LQTKGCAKIMAVMMPREKWTDDRLDDLNQKVDDGFKKVDGRFDKVDARFNHLDKKIDRLTYCLLVGAIGYIATHGL